MWSKVCFYKDEGKVIHIAKSPPMYVKAIPIPDNATNGDVIKVLFPNDCVKQENGDKIVFSFIRASGTIIIDAEWWNAPYKPESEDNGCR